MYEPIVYHHGTRAPGRWCQLQLVQLTHLEQSSAANLQKHTWMGESIVCSGPHCIGARRPQTARHIPLSNPGGYWEILFDVAWRISPLKLIAARVPTDHCTPDLSTSSAGKQRTNPIAGWYCFGTGIAGAPCPVGDAASRSSPRWCASQLPESFDFGEQRVVRGVQSQDQPSSSPGQSQDYHQYFGSQALTPTQRYGHFRV